MAVVVTVTTAVLIVAFLLLVAVLFGLAMIEASLLHLRRSAVAAGAEHGDRRSQLLLAALDDLPRVMNAVLLAVLLAQVTATSLAGVIAQQWATGLGVTIATVVVTMILFVYGEAIPKTIAIRNPLRHARRLIRITHWIERALRPVVTALVWLAKVQSPRADGPGDADTVTERELRHITDEAAAAGEIGPSDAELIDKSFLLGDLTAQGVLVPAAAIVSVPETASVRQAVDISLRAGHRRLPVSNSAGRLIGFVRLPDLAGSLISAPERPVGELVRDGRRVPVDRTLIEILRDMQTSNCRLAFVEDATGVTVGMLTVEDIVEELLGPIDEHDPTPPDR